MYTPLLNTALLQLAPCIKNAQLADWLTSPMTWQAARVCLLHGLPECAWAVLWFTCTTHKCVWEASTAGCGVPYLSACNGQSRGVTWLAGVLHLKSCLWTGTLHSIFDHSAAIAVTVPAAVCMPAVTPLIPSSRHLPKSVHHKV